MDTATPAGKVPGPGGGSGSGAAPGPISGPVPAGTGVPGPGNGSGNGSGPGNGSGFGSGFGPAPGAGAGTGSDAGPSGRPGRPRRGLRVVRALVIAGVVLGGLFVAADRLAVGYAEDRIADRIDSSGHGGADGTEVEISGFPFLTQALDHRLERVDVRLKGVRTTTSDGHRMSISQLETRFHDVKLSDDYSGGTASRADGTARVTYGDLDRASQSGATVAYGGSPGKLKVTAGVSLLGRTITRSVISTITLVDGDTVRVRADAVPGEGIPGVEELVREKTDFDRDLEGLPAGLTLSSLTSDKDGLALTLTGAAVSLTSR